MGQVLIYLAPGFEETEAITTIDLLRRATIEVTVAGLKQKTITGSHGITVVCDADHESVDPDEYEYLILPGGQPGTNNLKADPQVIKSIQNFAEKGKLIGAICAAPTVLEKANVVKNRRVTSYPSERQVFTSSKYEEQPVVRDQNIVTSRGVGTAIEFALELVGIIKGENVKSEIAGQILYQLSE